MNPRDLDVVEHGSGVLSVPAGILVVALGYGLLKRRQDPDAG